MFYVVTKFPVGDKLEVAIRQDKPYVMITAKILPEDDGEDEKLIAAVLEAFYKEHFKERAKKEALEEVKAAVDEAKKKADAAMPLLVNGNTLDTILSCVLISDDTRLHPGDYKGIVEYLPEIKVGETYKNGQFVKVKDPAISAAAESGQYICVRLNKGDGYKYDGYDIAKDPNPWKNGFDARRYDAYARVHLGTATNTDLRKK